MRSIGLSDSLMYGGYEVPRALSSRIPVRVDEQPAFGVGKYTTAWDMTSLWRALWLASGGKGPAPRVASRGSRRPTRRYLLWLTAHVRDQPKLDTTSGASREVACAAQGGLDLVRSARHGARVLAGRRLRRERHDVARRGGVSTSSDRLAGRCRGDRAAAFTTHREAESNASDAAHVSSRYSS